MSLLDSGERKGPEIIVHQLQEALAYKLEVLGILVVGLETVKESVSILSNYMQTYAEIDKVCNICKKKVIYAQYAKTWQICRT